MLAPTYAPPDVARRRDKIIWLLFCAALLASASWRAASRERTLMMQTYRQHRAGAFALSKQRDVGARSGAR